MTAAHVSEPAAEKIGPQLAVPLPALRVSNQNAALETLLGDNSVLMVVGFGTGAPVSGDPRYRRVPLEPVADAAPLEVWRGQARMRSGSHGALRWISDGDYAFVTIEVDESGFDGVAATARHAYLMLGTWLETAPTPHVLRIWNYLDAINSGDGDDERYRQFCYGRAGGMRSAFGGGFPAATAIGVRDGRRVIRVYAIAAREPGTVLENPRQLSAWRYPRQYGPSAPTFARAMHAPTFSPQLYISGTAAIVGHASHHCDDFAAQLHETLANLRSLLEAADVPPPRHFGAGSVFKAYVRRPQDAAVAARQLRASLPAPALLLLQGDICRRELLIEIDGVQTA
jgi:chorismate lyase/3-hydroxybenzoate synthase